MGPNKQQETPKNTVYTRPSQFYTIFKVLKGSSGFVLTAIVLNQEVKNTSDPRWRPGETSWGLGASFTSTNTQRRPKTQAGFNIYMFQCFWWIHWVKGQFFIIFWSDLLISPQKESTLRLRTDMGWDIVPWGFERLLSWIQKEYSPKGGILVPSMKIGATGSRSTGTSQVTENGCAVRETTEEEAVNDRWLLMLSEGSKIRLKTSVPIAPI